MEEHISYQLAAEAVGAAVVSAIRLNPGCEPSEFVTDVLNSLNCCDDLEADAADLPTLTAPAIRSLNHALFIAVGYLGADEGAQHSAVENVKEIIETVVIDSLQKW